MKRLQQSIIMVLVAIASYSQVTITMEEKGGVFYIPGKINCLQLQFIFDTGASNVYISLTEALFMLKNGYISDKDLGGRAYAQVADGTIVENTEVNLREIEVAGIKIHNIKAYVSNSLDAPLLFGQSAIQKLGPIQIHGNELTIANGENIPSEEGAFRLYTKGYQLVEAGQYEEAIKVSEEALKYTHKKELRALLYDNMGTAYNRMGNHTKAIEMMNKALSEDYMCIQAQYNLGVYYFEDNQLENALRAFQLVLDKTQNGKLTKVGAMDISMFIPDALGYMGQIQTKLRCYKDAESNLLRSISLNPTAPTYLALADLYGIMNEFAKAADNYEKGILYEPMRPSNIKRYHQMGMCYFYAQNYKKAYDSFKGCIDATKANNEYLEYYMNSDDEEMKNFAAMCYSLAMDSELWTARVSSDPYECIRIFQERIFQNPFLSENLTIDDFIRLHQAYLQLGDEQKALETINLGIDKTNNNPELLFIKTTFMNDTDPQRLQILKDLLKQEYSYTPKFFDFGTVNNNIAWYYCLVNQSAEGLPYSLKAVRQNPEHAYSWETLGEIYYNLGRYQDCIDAMTKCITIEQNTKSAYEFRAKAYRKLGRKKEASSDEETARNLL